MRTVCLLFTMFWLPLLLSQKKTSFTSLLKICKRNHEQINSEQEKFKNFPEFCTGTNKILMLANAYIIRIPCVFIV